MKMTKELDARARAYAKKMCDQYGDEEQVWTDSYNTYIEIAAEQRAVDEADYTEQMRLLNEEWKENLSIQRQMLNEKACKSPWISAEERLPEDGQLILYAIPRKPYWFYDTVYYPEPHITDDIKYWMPIPALPKEDNQ